MNTQPKKHIPIKRKTKHKVPCEDDKINQKRVKEVTEVQQEYSRSNTQVNK